jgi:predicted flap endonuclease-1-like 5' DNA nuclease
MGIDWCWLLPGLLVGWLSHALYTWWTIRRSYNDLGTSLSSAETELNRYRLELDGVHTDLSERVRAHAALEQEVLGLRPQVARLESADAELTTLKTRLTDLEGIAGRVPALETDLVGARARVNDLEGQLHARVSDVSVLTARVAELEPFQARFASLDAELNTVRSSHSQDLSNLQARLSEAEAARAKLDDALKFSVAEVGKLRGDLAEAEATRNRIPELETLLASLQARVTASQGLGMQLQARDAELSRLRNTLIDAEAMRGKAAQLERDLDSINLRFKQLEAERQRERNSAVSHAKELADELSSLRLKLTEFERTSPQLIELQQTKLESESRLNAVQTERDQVRSELSTRARELAARDAELAGLRAQLTELEKTVSDTQSRIKSVQDERDRALSGLGAKDAELARLQQRTTDLERLNGRNASLEAELNDLREKLRFSEASVARLGALEPQLNSLTRQLSALMPYRERATQLEAALLEAQTESARLRSELEQARTVPDDLTKVDGIGAVFARRLNSAGISRFTQLAQTPAEHLHEIIKPEEWQKIEFEHWREDALILANGGTPAKRARVRERLSRITGIGDVYEKRLHEAEIHTFSQLAGTSVDRLLEITGAESRDEVELWIAEAGAYAQGKRPSRERERTVRGRLSEAEDELERLRVELRRAESLRRDPFLVMTQIGEVKQRKLYGAGIYLFKDLAQTSEARLREIFDHETLDYPLIQREAAEYARGEFVVVRGRRADRFERLTGVSEDDSRKLYEAGILSFVELSALSSVRLTEIVGRAGIDGWVAEAGLFAAGKAQIEFVDAGKRHRDQLWRIDGIGEVFEVRLNKAGIFSFEELSTTSPSRLQEIIQPQTWERIEPESWIAQARELAAHEVRE